jgi:hypothetical protein
MTTELSDILPDTGLMPAVVRRYRADLASLEATFGSGLSPRRQARMAEFYETWTTYLNALEFASLEANDRADVVLLTGLIDLSRRQLERDAGLFEEMRPLAPFADALTELDDRRRRMLDVDPEASAHTLHKAQQSIASLSESLADASTDHSITPFVAARAAKMLDGIATDLAAWFTFYAGYDPLFTWWAEHPYRALMSALSDYAVLLRNRVAKIADPDTILGDPVGRDALLDQLRYSMIAYSPEELIAIADQEAAWCKAELERAAGEMGLGTDWHAALERVKQAHIAPGRQPALVRDLAEEAVRYITERDLLTVPPLAVETWRMEMMSAEKQKINPFFLGGDSIIVSFPTAEMDHTFKQMSLRGNNRHFARATVQHELIPGHRMQAWAQERYRPYREAFYTPFWVEGWTLHWEMLLWELGFPQSPEDRIGMLFWRHHRAARVRFSLSFHLGLMTPQECIDLLVNEVGHERENAAAEVRRSFGGDYDPLYQCAYLIGGMQMHALYREATTTGGMTARAFHDSVLHANSMPIPILRALVLGHPIAHDFPVDWRFAKDEV